MNFIHNNVKHKIDYRFIMCLQLGIKKVGPAGTEIKFELIDLMQR